MRGHKTPLNFVKYHNFNHKIGNMRGHETPLNFVKYHNFNDVN